LKLGQFYSNSEREFKERQIYYPDIIGFDGNPNNYLRDDNLGFRDPPSTNNATGRIRYDWQRYIQTFDSTYSGSSDIAALYLMSELPITDRIKLIGGVRLESTDLQVNSSSYVENSVTGERVNSTSLSQNDVLPAVGLIFSPAQNMNVRLHYSETIARPSFRELAAYRSYDPVLDTLLDGNPLLVMSAIKNYDLRWEWFPRPGELLSVGFYYKDIKNAIERRFVDLLGDIITFENRPTASLFGVEFEARKSLDFLEPRLRYWSLGGNFSFIESEVDLTEVEYQNKQQYVPDAEKTRPLYDQSPFVINVDLSFDHPEWGTSASLILNAAGPRVSIASLTTEDVYEHPPLTLDFVIAQKLNRHLTARFSAKNLLDPEYERTYGKDSNLCISYTRGRTFAFSLTYDF
jgi:TonB-dependent receptor